VPRGGVGWGGVGRPPPGMRPDLCGGWARCGGGSKAGRRGEVPGWARSTPGGVRLLPHPRGRWAKPASQGAPCGKHGPPSPTAGGEKNRAYLTRGGRRGNRGPAPGTRWVPINAHPGGDCPRNSQDSGVRGGTDTDSGCRGGAGAEGNGADTRGKRPTYGPHQDSPRTKTAGGGRKRARKKRARGRSEDEPHGAG
jgi:hypothetical protein